MARQATFLTFSFFAFLLFSPFIWKHEASAEAGFARIAQVPVSGVAEIISAAPDGDLLIYTDAEKGRIGLIEISDPYHPVILSHVDVRENGVGEPTSAALTVDGRYAVVAVRMGDDAHKPYPGLLRVYDLNIREKPRLVKTKTVGIGPDSVYLAGEGSDLLALVAIEDEEDEDNLPGKRPGYVNIIGLQDLYGGISSGVRRVDFLPEDLKNAQYPTDPQPEYIAIHQTGTQALVTLQENNAVALIDIGDPAHPELTRIFSLGTVERIQDADVHNDGEIALVDSMKGRREPDAITWVGPKHFATANEGDTGYNTFGRNEYSGGRGFTLFDLKGRVVFESASASDRLAVLYGHYPDSRSGKRGIEMEGITSGVYDGRRYLFAASERGSFVEVHDVSKPASPKFIQFLPTGQSPEGLLAMDERADMGLFVAANENDGTIDIFGFKAQGWPSSSGEPVLMASNTMIPWSALSGLTSDGAFFYSVPDNAMTPSRILRINPAELDQGRLLIDQTSPLRDAQGAISIDPEGIAWSEAHQGFWVASEGKTGAENQLLLVRPDGWIEHRHWPLESLIPKLGDPGKWGFEGVDVSSDGKTIYLVVQRGFSTTDQQAAIIKYQPETRQAEAAFYPLDTHSSGPDKLWTGLSAVALINDETLLLLERDKGAGAEAEIKRVYQVKASEVYSGNVVNKKLVKDLVRENHYLLEKVEAMAVFHGDIWVMNDNDGAGWTRILNIGSTP